MLLYEKKRNIVTKTSQNYVYVNCTISARNPYLKLF